MNSKKAYIEILSRSFYSSSTFNGVSKKKAISLNAFHILPMNQFSLLAKQGPLLIFVCVLIQKANSLWFSTPRKTNDTAIGGKLVPIKTIVQLWTRAHLDCCPYGMLNNGKSNSRMYKSRLIIFNKVSTFIWQIVLFFILAHKLEQICVNYLKCMLGCSLYRHIFPFAFPIPSVSPLHPREFCMC